MFLIITKYLIRGFRGITTFPFIFIRYPADKENRVFINHEKKYLRQQLELVLPFFIWYILSYLVRFVQYKTEIWLIGILVLSVRLTVMKLTLVI
jgi:hypothetical protein